MGTVAERDFDAESQAAITRVERRIRALEA